MGETSRRARAEVTRQQLVDAARVVFTERGYQAATVAAITEQATTAHGTFYLYFKNKEGAFLEVISTVLDELYQNSFTPFDDLPSEFSPDLTRQRIAGFFQVMVRHGRLWRALLEGALASTVVEQHWMGERRRFHEALAARFTRLQEMGVQRTIDPELAAYALSSMIEWFAMTGMAFGEPRPLDASDHVIDTVTDLWLRAMGDGR